MLFKVFYSVCIFGYYYGLTELCQIITETCLYPQHLCRGVYSFRLSIRMFIRLFARTVYTPSIYAEGYIVFVFPFVCSFVRSFVLPSVARNLRPSFALKFLKWCISQQLLIRKHSYLDHSYPGGFAFTP